MDKSGNLDRLISEISEGRCVVISGANLSINNSTQSLQDISSVLVTELGENIPEKDRDNYRKVFEYYENKFGRSSFLNKLSSYVNVGLSQNAMYDEFLQLPFKAIFTTNYDLLLETSLLKFDKKFLKISGSSDSVIWPKDEFLLVKMFGDVENLSSIVATDTDLALFFGTSSIVRQIFDEAAISSSLLFVGYDLNDPVVFQLIALIKKKTSASPIYFLTEDIGSPIKFSLSAQGVYLVDGKIETIVNGIRAYKPPSAITSFEKLKNLDEYQNICFILMPFSQEFDSVYNQVIKPTVKANGLNCVRADEIYDVGPIMDQIWLYIQKSKVIIAELTGKNPNVFYELGMSHAIQKKTILITQSIDDVPFDLRHQRCIVYTNSIDGAFRLKTHIDKTIKNINDDKKI